MLPLSDCTGENWVKSIFELYLCIFIFMPQKNAFAFFLNYYNLSSLKLEWKVAI